MANRTSDVASVSPKVVVIVLTVLVLLIGFIAWKSIGGTTEQPVKIDPNKLREQIQKNGLGHHS